MALFSTVQQRDAFRVILKEAGFDVGIQEQRGQVRHKHMASAIEIES